ncbi:MAG TPA: DUF92 domain-containing protein [Gemmatimonadaceae bacterium]|nr:DUF92 domain-containing protein [Gemmatimonadaceae bacterium]
MLPPLFAAALGPLVAGIVWKAGMLTTRGAIAAAALGATSAVAGLDWMALLLTFFISSVLLGRIGREEKRRRSAAVIEKAGPRDAAQVLANGAVFGIGAGFAMDARISTALAATALGALAAATADTWGTEIGMLSRQAPRSILTWQPLEPGMSGGVSMQGLFATAGGACVIGLLAYLLQWPAQVAIAATVGGITGAMSDSLLGATLQQRRRSTRTGRITERTRDSDGTPTERAGGLQWLDNDGVNFAATLIGAGTAFQVNFLLSALRTA